VSLTPSNTGPAEAGVGRAGERRLDRVDLLVGAVIGSALAVLLFALHQRELWGDGVVLHRRLLDAPSLPWWDLHWHAAYFPVARFLGWVAPTERAIDGFILASSLPVAIAVVLDAWSLRLLGLRRAPAFVTSLLAGSTPAMVYFGTLLEVHGLHFGGVAATLFLSLVALRASSTRRVLALQIAAFAPASLTHTTALVLVPGFAAWCAATLAARESRDAERAVGPRQLVRWASAVAGGCTAVWLATLGLIELGWTADGHSGLVAMFDIVDEAFERTEQRDLLADWVLPYGLALVPLAIALVALTRRGVRARLAGGRRLVLVAAAVWIVVPTVVFNAWTIRNHGGYSAALVPMLAIALGVFGSSLPRSFAARAWWILVAALAALQITRTSLAQRARNAAFAASVPAVFDAARDALPEGGVLVTDQPRRFDLSTFDARWHYVDVDRLWIRRDSGAFLVDAHRFALEEVVELGVDAVLDTSFLATTDAEIERQNARFVRALEEHFDFDVDELPSNGVVVLRRRGR